MKIDKNLLMGIISLILTAIFGILSIRGDIFHVLLFTFLFLAAAVAAAAFYSVVIPNILKIQPNWHSFSPFTAMLFVSRLLFGWDLFIPFCVVSFLSLMYDLFCSVVKEKKQIQANAAVLIISSGIGFASLFAIISVCGGILL